MSLIDKIKTQFSERVSGHLLSIDVPEWECKIYFKPSISLSAQAPISRLLSEGKSEEALVQSLIVRALDENGKPLFRAADKVELMHRADPEIVGRIARDMNVEELSTEEMGND